MITTPEVVVEKVAASVGPTVVDNIAAGVPERVVETAGFRLRREAAKGSTLFDMMLDAAKGLTDGIGGVVVATYTAPDRMPSLSTGLASALGLPGDIPAIDLSAACSAYPYALYVAGRLAADTGSRILLLDGDLQSPFVDKADAGTAALFSDAATATVVSCDPESSSRSHFAFLSRSSAALSCSAAGPVKMDGFEVFSFVAAEVAEFLSDFAGKVGDVDCFVPHQANMFMVRRLAKSIGLSDRLLTSGEIYANPGSCSVPLTLAHRRPRGRALLAGFGAGLSAAAAAVRIML